MPKQWFPEHEVAAAKQLFVRRQKVQLFAALGTAVAFVLAFYFSGCEAIQQRWMMFWWLVLAPMATLIAGVLLAERLPSQLGVIIKEHRFALGLILIVPFWLIGLLIMAIIP